MSLCLSCGMCCDGTLFRTVELAPEEVEPWRRRGLSIVQEDGSPRFTQPCPHHRGDACAIYDDRPGICRRFRCALLDKVSSGELALEEGMARVQRVKALARALWAVIHESPGRRTLREDVHQHLVTLNAAASATDAAFLRSHAELFMDLKTFEILVKRDFLPPSC